MFMPSTEEMVETSTMMQERFHLPRFAMAVDGMMVRFVEAPRGLPQGMHKQQFWCRYFSCQLLCKVLFFLYIENSFML